MTDFDPGRGLEWGAKGVFGLRSAKIDPGRPLGRALRIRMTDFEPGRALERVAEGVFGLGNAKSDPARPS